MDTLEYARNRYVTVETDSNAGTGIILGTNLVLTCFHILETDSHVEVNKQQARIAVCAPEYDMILLHCKTHECEPMTFAEPILDRRGFYYGNPGKHRGIRVPGTVVDITTGLVFFDGRVRSGASGSGLYQDDGLIGMVVALETKNNLAGFGVAIHKNVIEQFLKEVLYR